MTVMIPKVVIIDDRFETVDFRGNGDIPVRKASHGLMCTRVFQKFAVDCDLRCVPVAKSPGADMTVEDTVALFEKTLSQDPDLIIMSMGTTNPLMASQFERCVNLARKQGVIIVCACSNDNLITYPASMPGVIGVRSERYGYLPQGAYCVVDNPLDGIDIISAMPGSEGSESPVSNSVTTQYVAAKICNLLTRMGGRDVDRVMSELRKGAYPTLYKCDYYKKMFHCNDRADRPVVLLRGSKANALKLAGQLSVLLANDGYCAGIAGDTVEHMAHRLQFSFEKMFPSEKLAREEKIPLIFSMASIDLLFVLADFPEGGQPLDRSVVRVEIKEEGYQTYIVPSSTEELEKLCAGLVSLLS